ncbi:MAG: META domain-containing protein [Hydrogenophaga sp.]|uniref:META domain-containing protein n=1 Tax=Hydrogenophaga sp. TaxID=1904254 RepID=UPI001E18AD8D|nr:META domain-containing protein [Hydrogenophaga sp.]MBX3610083.1 META domain-containing protein [Hydrogenophaga sp.]
MSPLRIALALPLLCTLFACAMPGGSAPDVVGTEWRLQDLHGVKVVDGVQATLAFPEAGRVAGFGSCNRFFGTYTQVGHRMAFGQLGMTRMACPGPIGEQETRYLAALQQVKGLRLERNELLLEVEGQIWPLRFAPVVR